MMGAEKRLPLVVGVLGDFSGRPRELRTKLRDRKFVTIDSVRFNGVMRMLGVQAQVEVPNRLGGSENLQVLLQFKELADFDFDAIAAQIDPILRLRNIRDNLLAYNPDESRSRLPLDSLLSGDITLDSLLSPDRSDTLSADQIVAELIGLVDTDLKQTRQHRLGFFQRIIASIDQAVAAQIKEIMETDAVRSLEAAWRGLHRLVSSTSNEDDTHFSILDVTKNELYKDFARSVEPEEGTLYRLLYIDALDTLGGTPFTLLIGNYELDHSPADIKLISDWAHVGQASGVPLLAAAAPSIFGVRELKKVHRINSIAHVLDPARPEYAQWFSFRHQPAAAFVSLCLPRVLLAKDKAPNGDVRYLWGNPAFEVVGWLIERITEVGWCEFDVDPEQNYLRDLPSSRYRDVDGTPRRVGPTDVVIENSDVVEDIKDYIQGWELVGHGFVPLVVDTDTARPRVLALSSLYLPDPVEESDATALTKDKLLGMLSYSLAISRIRNNIRIAFRDGAGRSAEEIRDELEHTLEVSSFGHTNTTSSLRVIGLRLQDDSRRRGVQVTAQVELGSNTLDPKQTLPLEVLVPRSV